MLFLSLISTRSVGRKEVGAGRRKRQKMGNGDGETTKEREGGETP